MLACSNLAVSCYCLGVTFQNCLASVFQIFGEGFFGAVDEQIKRQLDDAYWTKRDLLQLVDHKSFFIPRIPDHRADQLIQEYYPRIFQHFSFQKPIYPCSPSP